MSFALVLFLFLFHFSHFCFCQPAPTPSARVETRVDSHCRWISQSNVFSLTCNQGFLVTSRVACKGKDWVISSLPMESDRTPYGWELYCYNQATWSFKDSSASTGDISILCCDHYPRDFDSKSICSTRALDGLHKEIAMGGGSDCRMTGINGIAFLGASLSYDNFMSNNGQSFFPSTHGYLSSFSRSSWYGNCLRTLSTWGFTVNSARNYETLVPRKISAVFCDPRFFSPTTETRGSFLSSNGGYCNSYSGLTTDSPSFRCDSESKSVAIAATRFRFVCPAVPSGTWSELRFQSAPTSPVPSGGWTIITCSEGFFIPMRDFDGSWRRFEPSNSISANVTCGPSTLMTFVPRCVPKPCWITSLVPNGRWSFNQMVLGETRQPICNTGFVSNGRGGTCTYNSTTTEMVFNLNGAACVLFAVVGLAVDTVQSSNYRLVVTWSAPPVSGIQGYQIAYSRNFPNFGTTEFNANQASLGGIMVNSDRIGDVTHSSSISVYRFPIQVDSFKQIAGIRGTVTVTPYGSIGTGTPFSVAFRLPCACDYSLDLDGTVQFFSVFHDVEANRVNIRFTPNSLCAHRYRLNIFSNETQWAIVNTTVDTLLIQTADSCPFRTEVIAPLTSVDGVVIRPCRSYSYRISALPQSICPTCVTQFSIGNSLPTASLWFSANFSFLVAGQVTTPINAASPTGVGIPDISIIVDVFSISDSTYNNSLWRQQVITNSLGNFRCRVSSAILPNPPYVARVMAFKRDRLSNGSFFEHQFVSTFNQSNAAFFMRVDVDQRTEQVGFYDISTVQITARIVTNFVYVDENLNRFFQLTNPILQAAQSSSTASLATSGSCGVPNVILTSYRTSDIQRTSPISVSDASDSNGYVYISTPIFTSIVLVPSYSNAQVTAGLQQIVHTFSPASVSVSVAAEPVILAPIADTTMAVLNITVLGGSSRSHIGAIRPVLQYSTCASANNRIPLAMAGVPGRWDLFSKTISYQLPAQRFALFWSAPFPGVKTGFQPADRGNPFTYKANARPDAVSRPVDATDPYFIESDVATWVRNLPNQEVNLLRGQAAIELTYYAPVVATLKDPDGAQRCNVSRPGGFYGLSKHVETTLVFELTETYGPTSSLANPAFVYSGFQINRNVSGFVVVNDGFSDAARQLSAPPGGLCENRVCSILAVYDPDMKRTTANYSLLVGEIEISPTTSFGIPYGRRSTYFANGSLTSTGLLNRQAPVPIYAVIAGKLVYPGSFFVTYPPQSPLQIIREPPGSHSYAYLAAGTELHTALTLSRSIDIQGETIRQFSPYTDQDQSTCVGIGAAVCKKVGQFLVKTRFQLNERSASPTGASSAALYTYKFDQTIKTAGVREKRGDIFVTLSASVAIQKAIEVSLTNPGCIAASQTLLTWTIDPEKTLEFIDEYSINNVMIPDLQSAVATNLELLGYSSFDEFASAGYAPKDSSFYSSLTASVRNKLPETAANTKDAGLAIQDWKGLLNWNNYLKASASVFVDFLQHVDGPADFSGWPTGNNPYSSNVYTQQRVDEALQSNPDKSDPTLEPVKRDSLELIGRESTLDAMTFSAADVVGAAIAFATGFNPVSAYTNIAGALDKTFPKLPNQMVGKTALVADNTFGSFTFYGGGERIEMTLETKLGKTQRDYKSSMYKPSVRTGVFGEASLLGVGFKSDIGSESFFQFSHGAEEFASADITNRFGVFLQDEDAGDEFKIAILKDNVYAAPVFRMLAGKSRCINEPGTLPRDQVEFTIANSAMTDVNPNEPAATSITMVNVSPSKENFTYSLTIDETTNRNGLIVSVNGQILNSDDKAFQVFLPYTVPVTLILEAVRSRVARYSFHGIELILSSSIDRSDSSHLVCYETSVFFSVDFLSPCNQVQFAGSYTSDVPFSVNLADLNGGNSIPIAVSNPQRAVPWFRWFHNAGLGKLQSIALDYRPTSGTELDWIALRDAATGVGVSIALPTDSTQPNQDFAIFNWDVSSLIEGEFYVRARTICSVVSSVDRSLNGFTAPLLRGRIDQRRPTVFGFPHPSQYERFIPGTEISISFTEPIQCNAISAYYWVNPRDLPLSGPMNFPQASSAGLVRDAYTQCDQLGETVYLAFAAPNLLQMDDVVISVFLAGVKDLAANPLNYKAVDYATWSFKTANLSSLQPFLPGHNDGTFSSASSSSSGDSYTTSLVVSMAADLSVLTSAFGSQTELIQRLQAEIQDLIVASAELNETSLETVRQLILHNVRLEALHNDSQAQLDKLLARADDQLGDLDDISQTLFAHSKSTSPSASTPSIPADAFVSYAEAPNWFDFSRGFNLSDSSKFEFSTLSGNFLPSIVPPSIQLFNGSVNSSSAVWLVDAFPYSDRDFLIDFSTSQLNSMHSTGLIGDGFTITFTRDITQYATGTWSFIGAFGKTSLSSPSISIGFNFLDNRVDLFINGSLSNLRAVFIPPPLLLRGGSFCSYRVAYKAANKLFQVTINQANATTAEMTNATVVIPLTQSLSQFFGSSEPIRFGFTSGSGLILGSWTLHSLRVTADALATNPAVELGTAELTPSGKSYGPRAGSRSVAVGNLIFLVGGRSLGSCSDFSDVQIYDGNRVNQWFTLTQHAEFPARSDHGLVYSNGRLFVFGGRQCDGRLLSDVWMSGIEERLGLDWQLVAGADFNASGIEAGDSFPFASVGEMIYMVRQSMQLFALNTSDLMSWVSVGSPFTGFSEPKYSSLVPIADTLFLQLSSWSECDYCTSALQFYFDFAALQWIQMSSRPTERLSGRLDRALAAFGSRIFAAGGVDSDDVWTAEFAAINKETRTIRWTRAPFSLATSSKYVGGNLIALPKRAALFAFAFGDRSVVQILCPISFGVRCQSPFSSELPRTALRFSGSSISSGSLVFQFDLHRPQLVSPSSASDPSSIAHQLYLAAQLRIHEDAARFPLLSLLDCSTASHNQSLANCARAIRAESRVEVYSHSHLSQSDLADSSGDAFSFNFAERLPVSGSENFLNLSFSSALTASRPEFGIFNGEYPWSASNPLAFGNSTLFIRWIRSYSQATIDTADIEFSAYMLVDDQRAEPSQLEALRQLHKNIKEGKAANPFQLTFGGAETLSQFAYAEETSSSGLVHCQLAVKHLPVLIGGSDYNIHLKVGPNSFEAKTFLAGPPSQPRFLQVSQTAGRELVVHVLPSVQSGLTHQVDLENVETSQFAIYYRKIRNSSTSNSLVSPTDASSFVRLPGSIASFELSSRPFRIPSSIRIDLNQLHAEYGVPINSTSIQLAIQTITKISSSLPVYFTAPIIPPPAPISLLGTGSVRRLTFNSFQLNVHVSEPLNSESVQLAARVGSEDSKLMKLSRSSSDTSPVDGQWRLLQIASDESHLFHYTIEVSVDPTLFAALPVVSAPEARQLEFHISNSNSVGELSRSSTRWLIPSSMLWLSQSSQLNGRFDVNEAQLSVHLDSLDHSLQPLPGKLASFILDAVIGVEISVTIQPLGLQRSFQHWRPEITAASDLDSKFLIEPSSWSHSPSDFDLSAFPSGSSFSVSLRLLTERSHNLHERHHAPHLDSTSSAVQRCPAFALGTQSIPSTIDGKP